MMVDSTHVQIKLTPENERLIEEYRLRTPSADAPWHPSPTAVANNAIKEWMEVKAMEQAAPVGDKP